jgi:pyruvate ferredoxin oxidoreductase alpha subunit
MVDPEYYLEARYALQMTLNDVLGRLPKISAEFKAAIGRDYGDCLVEEYRTQDADKVIVAAGSVCGTIKEVVDELRRKGKKAGLLRVISFRPFPYARVCAALKDVPRVAVLDKAVSLGAYPPIATEIRAAFCGKKKRPAVISSFVAGLGGRDITLDTIRQVFSGLTAKELAQEFVDLKPELLKDEYAE